MLEITKTITGDAAHFPGGRFDFSIGCGGNHSYSTFVDIAADGTSGSVQFDIPTGSVCAVSETGTPAAGTDYQWLDPIIAPSPVTIVGGQTVTVSVTNPRDFIEKPALGIDKTADTASYNEAGDILHYTIVATNTGNVTLHGVTVSDPILGALACDPVQGATGATLAPNATMTCAGTYTATQADVDAGHVDNTATAASAETKPVDDSAIVPAVQGPALGVVKTADTASYDGPGDVLHYTIVATNLGNVTLHGVTIADPKLGTLSCDKAQGAPLAPNATMTCTGTYTATQADVDAGHVDNTATADSTETAPVDDSARVLATQSPGLSVTKGVGLAADGDFSSSLTTSVGTTVYYEIVLSNTGNVTLTGVTLADSLYALADLGCAVPSTLAVGGSYTCTYSVAAKAGSTENTATADSAQTDPSADSATVFAPPPTALIVEKKLDLDSSPDTTLLAPGGAGWSFHVSGDPGMSGTTGADSTYTFDLTGLERSDLLNVTETLRKDFDIQDASCEVVVPTPAVDAAQVAGESRGTFDKASATMREVLVYAGETVKCTFVNVSGAVEEASATPHVTPRITPPPTDTLPVTGTPGGDSWRIALLALAALLASILLLTPTTPAAVRRRR